MSSRNGLPAAPLADAYGEAWDRQVGAYLTPVHADGRRDTTRPVAKLLWAQKYRDRWHQLAPMAALLTNAAGPLVVCVDIAQVGDNKVRRTLEEYESSAGTRLGGGNLEIGYGYQAIKTMTEESPVIVATRLLVLLLAPSVRNWPNAPTPSSPGQSSGCNGTGSSPTRPAPTATSPRRCPAVALCLSPIPLMAALFCGMWGVGRHYPPGGVLAGCANRFTRTASAVCTPLRGENQVNHRTILGRQGSGKTAASMTLDFARAARGVKADLHRAAGQCAPAQAFARGQLCRLPMSDWGDADQSASICSFSTARRSKSTSSLLALLVSLVQHSGNAQHAFGFDIQAAVDRSFNAVYAAYRVEELYGKPENTPLFQEFVHNLLAELEPVVQTFGRWLEANFVNDRGRVCSTGARPSTCISRHR